MLRTRGWPFSCATDDVAAFFSGYALASRDPVIVLSRKGDGRFSGEAFVVFASEGEASRARAALHNSMVQERRIELIPSLKAEAVAAAGGAWFLRPDAMSRAALYLRGLPFAASPEEVAAWMGPHAPPTLRSVFITMLMPAMRPSGA